MNNDIIVYYTNKSDYFPFTSKLIKNLQFYSF